MKTEIKISGMSCGHCVKAVENSIKSLRGINRVSVDLAAGKAAVDFDESAASLEDIKNAVTEAGYVPE